MLLVILVVLGTGTVTVTRDVSSSHPTVDKKRS